MKILTKESMIDLKQEKSPKEKIYHPNKKCSICGMPYVENHKNIGQYLEAVSYTHLTLPTIA